MSRVNDPSEWREADAPHLAIVDQDTFDRAALVLKERTKKQKGDNYTRRPRRILSGLLRCPKCAGGMSIHDKRGSAIRIRCSRSIESGSCENNRRYRLDKIETAVVDGLRSQLEHPEAMAAYVKAYREERQADVANARRNRARLERRVAELKGQMDRLMKALARGTLPVEAVEQQYGPLDEEKKQVEIKLAAVPAEPPIELHPRAVERYRQAVEKLAERMTDVDPAGHDREAVEILRSLIHSVVVHELPDGRVEAEVIGHLSRIVGKDAEYWGVPDLRHR